MPKRKWTDRNDEVETVTFSMPEDSPSCSINMATPTMTRPSPLPEQVFSISEWTIDDDRVTTSNPLFSSVIEPALSTSFRESNDDLHIPGTYHGYDASIDVTDFQSLPESLEPPQPATAQAQTSKSTKVR